MNTINGNFIEKSIPNTKNATIVINIGGVDATMTVEKFAAVLPAPASSYGIYTAVLNQNGNDAPTAVILENTLGVIPTYSVIQSGQYLISGITPVLYSTSKVFIIVQGGDINIVAGIVGGGGDAGKIQFINYNSSGVMSSFGANKVHIEIRVYN
jgi:hypothetical protein